MRIRSIQATTEKLRIFCDGTGEVCVRESVATVGEKKGRMLTMLRESVRDGVITIPRFEGRRDRIYSRFTVFSEGKACEGVIYVTDIAADIPANTADYPVPNSIKTLAAPAELTLTLGLEQSLLNINLPNIMTMFPSEDTLEYTFNARTFYFRKSAVEAIDAHMRKVPMTTMILLNAPHLFGSTGETALLEACLHPHYDNTCSNAYISAFDMETEEGQSCYGAFVEFLVERYTRPDRKYGCAVGAIISNEVNSQYVWGNAGEMPVEKYTAEYAQALRFAWLCARKHSRSFRVYISLDQFWCGTNFDASQKERFYSGRTMLELLNGYACAEGNFDWSVAYHPYPEDLHNADFWNDRAPDFTFSTPKITFKNMEVLEAFLSQKEFLYRGCARRIIFSEQGFNSLNGPLQAWSEKAAAAAYVLAFLKVRNMKTVDLFTHHARVDNPHEFGLNLGIFRYDPEKPHHMGEPKPIYESFLAMDTENEEKVVCRARAFIGEDLFDYLLAPPLVYGERDTSQDNAFGA